MIHVVDNFVDPKEERERALSASYETLDHNGLKYPGISMCQDEKSIDKIAGIVGTPILFSDVMYRYYDVGMEQSTFIHSDVLIANYTAILFLSECKTNLDGLAFWEHKKYGWIGHPSDEQIKKSGIESTNDFWRRIWEDGMDQNNWFMTKFVPMRPGRLVIFPGRMYHSRYPKEQTAHGVEDGRLIKVMFCR